MFMQSVTNAAMEKALEGTWKKTQLIATNIANEDTPGYKAKRLDFASRLQTELSTVRNSKAMDRGTALSRIRGVESRVYEDTATIGRADGNNVDILAEQSEYARVQLQYQALTQRVGSYYTNLRYAISGGR